MDVGEDVDLAHEMELAHPIALAGEVERVANRALGPEASRHVHLGRCLLGRALVLEPAHVAVQPLRVLPHHHEVDLLGALVLERALDAGVELDRPQVDVLVELEANTEEEPLLQDARRHLRMAHGSQVDCVEAAKLLQHGIRKDLAGLQVAVAAQVVRLGLVTKAGGGGSGLQDLQPLLNDLQADPVAGDHGYPVHRLLLIACPLQRRQPRSIRPGRSVAQRSALG